MICTVFYLCVLVLMSIPFLFSLLSETRRHDDLQRHNIEYFTARYNLNWHEFRKRGNHNTTQKIALYNLNETQQQDHDSVNVYLITDR